MSNTLKFKLSKKNENKIEEFENKLKSNGISNKRTLRSYIASTKAVLNLINKDYNNLNENDIIKAFSTEEYKPSSLEIMKAKFKHFLIFINKNDLAKTIGFNHSALNNPKYDEDDILTPEEINLLIDTPIKLSDRSLIELLISSGARRSEIANLKYSSIKIDGGIVWLNVKGKTGERKIPIVSNINNASAIPLDNFFQFYRSHKYTKEPQKPFFYSESNKNRYQGNFMTPQSITYKVEQIGNKSGIKRKITPHLLRHTSASYDGYHLTDGLLCKKYGWKKGSKQLERYSHLEEKQFGEHLLNNAGLTQKQIEKDSICPNCKNTVHINEKYCPYCKHILDRELLNKKIEKQQNKIENLEKLKIKIETLETTIENKDKRIQEEYVGLEQYENENRELKKKIKNITKDTSDTLDKISKSIKFVFFTSNPKNKIKIGKFISKNPKCTGIQIAEYMNKDFIEFQDSVECKVQINLLENFLKII